MYSAHNTFQSVLVDFKLGEKPMELSLSCNTINVVDLVQGEEIRQLPT